MSRPGKDQDQNKKSDAAITVNPVNNNASSLSASSNKNEEKNVDTRMQILDDYLALNERYADMVAIREDEKKFETEWLNYQATLNANTAHDNDWHHVPTQPIHNSRAMQTLHELLVDKKYDDAVIHCRISKIEEVPLIHCIAALKSLMLNAVTEGYLAPLVFFREQLNNWKSGSMALQVEEVSQDLEEKYNAQIALHAKKLIETNKSRKDDAKASTDSLEQNFFKKAFHYNLIPQKFLQDTAQGKAVAALFPPEAISKSTGLKEKNLDQAHKAKVQELITKAQFDEALLELHQRYTSFRNLKHDDELVVLYYTAKTGHLIQMLATGSYISLVFAHLEKMQLWVDEKTNTPFETSSKNLIDKSRQQLQDSVLTHVRHRMKEDVENWDDLGISCTCELARAVFDASFFQKIAELNPTGGPSFYASSTPSDSSSSSSASLSLPLLQRSEPPRHQQQQPQIDIEFIRGALGEIAANLNDQQLLAYWAQFQAMSDTSYDHDTKRHDLAVSTSNTVHSDQIAQSFMNEENYDLAALYFNDFANLDPDDQSMTKYACAMDSLVLSTVAAGFLAPWVIWCNLRNIYQQHMGSGFKQLQTSATLLQNDFVGKVVVHAQASDTQLAQSSPSLQRPPADDFFRMMFDYDLFPEASLQGKNINVAQLKQQFSKTKSSTSSSEAKDDPTVCKQKIRQLLGSKKYQEAVLEAQKHFGMQQGSQYSDYEGTVLRLEAYGLLLMELLVKGDYVALLIHHMAEIKDCEISEGVGDYKGKLQSMRTQLELTLLTYIERKITEDISWVPVFEGVLALVSVKPALNESFSGDFLKLLSKTRMPPSSNPVRTSQAIQTHSPNASTASSTSSSNATSTTLNVNDEDREFSIGKNDETRHIKKRFSEFMSKKKHDMAALYIRDLCAYDKCTDSDMFNYVTAMNALVIHAEKETGSLAPFLCWRQKLATYQQDNPGFSKLATSHLQLQIKFACCVVVHVGKYTNEQAVGSVSLPLSPSARFLQRLAKYDLFSLADADTLKMNTVDVKKLQTAFPKSVVSGGEEKERDAAAIKVCKETMTQLIADKNYEDAFLESQSFFRQEQSDGNNADSELKLLRFKAYSFLLVDLLQKGDYVVLLVNHFEEAEELAASAEITALKDMLEQALLDYVKRKIAADSSVATVMKEIFFLDSVVDLFSEFFHTSLATATELSSVQTSKPINLQENSPPSSSTPLKQSAPVAQRLSTFQPTPPPPSLSGPSATSTLNPNSTL